MTTKQPGISAVVSEPYCHIVHIGTFEIAVLTVPQDPTPELAVKDTIT